MDSLFLWLLLGVAVVAIAVAVLRMRGRVAEASGEGLVFRVKRSGEITLHGPATLLERDLSAPELTDSAAADLFSENVPAERFEELFRNFDSLRMAEELAALRDMIGFGLEQIDAMNRDDLGLGRAGLGVFPDPRTGSGNGGTATRAPAGFGVGGIASQDGPRNNPIRGPGQPGATAGQYFIYTFPGTTQQRNSDTATIYFARDGNGMVVGRDRASSDGTITHSSYVERNNDGSSRATWIDHQTNEKVQVTKDAEGRVTKSVEVEGIRIERETDSAGGIAGNPGDDPTEGQREMGMWLWRQHAVGRGAPSAPPTVVYINPPAPGETGPIDTGPRIHDYVELDIAGNPDPNNVGSPGMVPADYRERVERFMRERAGGLVNPPGPGTGPE